MTRTRDLYADIPAIMTFKQCTDILSISKNTLLGILQRGELVHFRVGKQYRIRREDLNEYIQNKVNI